LHWTLHVLNRHTDTVWDLGADYGLKVWALVRWLHGVSWALKMVGLRNSSPLPLPISRQHNIGCLSSIVSATNCVFWCSLYIPAIIHLIRLISLLLLQIFLPESISDQPGLSP